jgi:hypothetical protein
MKSQVNKAMLSKCFFQYSFPMRYENSNSDIRSMEELGSSNTKVPTLWRYHITCSWVTTWIGTSRVEEKSRGPRNWREGKEYHLQILTTLLVFQQKHRRHAYLSLDVAPCVQWKYPHQTSNYSSSILELHLIIHSGEHVKDHCALSLSSHLYNKNLRWLWK